MEGDTTPSPLPEEGAEKEGTPQHKLQSVHDRTRPEVLPQLRHRMGGWLRALRRSRAFKLVSLIFTVLVRPFYRYYTDGTNTYAGNVAFFSFLAFFPFLIFVTTLASFVKEGEAADRFLTSLYNTIPSTAVESIRPMIDSLIGNNNFSLLTGAILGTLWVSSNAVEAARVGLNRAYRQRDMRNYFYHRAKGLVVVIVGGLAIVLYATVILLLPVALGRMHMEDALRRPIEIIHNVGRIYLPFVMIPVILLFHRFLTKVKYSWLELLPGAVQTYILGSVLVYAFSAYVRSVGSFNVIYGGLGGIIVLLLFLYLNATVLLIGGEFNAVIHDEIRGKGLKETPAEEPPTTS